MCAIFTIKPSREYNYIIIAILLHKTLMITLTFCHRLTSFLNLYDITPRRTFQRRVINLTPYRQLTHTSRMKRRIWKC